jgi:hypothetical protein
LFNLSVAKRSRDRLTRLFRHYGDEGAVEVGVAEGGVARLGLEASLLGAQGDGGLGRRGDLEREVAEVVVDGSPDGTIKGLFLEDALEVRLPFGDAETTVPLTFEGNGGVREITTPRRALF